MGWAKYMEDNLEIISERLSRMDGERQHYEREQATVKVTVCIAPVLLSEKRAVAKREEKYIVCKDCGRVFSFPVKDQLYYEKMGWNPPKRCTTCREQRKIRHLMCSAY